MPLQKGMWESICKKKPLLAHKPCARARAVQGPYPLRSVPRCPFLANPKTSCTEKRKDVESDHDDDDDTTAS